MDLRQISVQDNHVVLIHECLFQTHGTVVGDVGREPLVPQPVGDVAGQRDLVFDDEHAHRIMLPEHALQRGNTLRHSSLLTVLVTCGWAFGHAGPTAIFVGVLLSGQA